MKFDVTESYCEDGSEYEFSCLNTWLIPELRKRVRPSENFVKKYGKDRKLTFVLSTKRGRKKPKIFEPVVYRRSKNIEWTISVSYVGKKSRSPASYVLPITQFIEGIVTVLQSLEIDTSKLSKDLPDLQKQFASSLDMIIQEYYVVPYDESEYRPKVAERIRKKKLPAWKIPQNIQKLVGEEGGTWESERFEPLRLMVMSNTSSRGGKIPLRWQIEFDIDLHDKQYASAAEKIKAMGNEPDGDGWTELIEKEFANRYPKYAAEFDSDSEMSTCVVSVESESACQKLIELVWSFIYPKPD